MKRFNHENDWTISLHPDKTKLCNPFTQQTKNDGRSSQHDYWQMVEHYHSYEQRVSWYHHTSFAPPDIKPPKKVRHRFTQDDKADIRQHYSITGNFNATAKVYGLNESTVRGIVKTPPITQANRKNATGAGRPLSYPLALDDQLLEWMLVQKDLNVPITTYGLQEKAKLIIRPHNPTFSASTGWVEKFYARHQNILEGSVPLSQKLPNELENNLKRFYKDARSILTDKNLSNVCNMDEIPVFFDVVSSKCPTKKGAKEYIVRTSNIEKKQMTVVLTITANGKILTPLVIFKETSDKVLQRLNIPTRIFCKANQKSWIDAELMQTWLDQIWSEYLRAVNNEKANSLILLDAFEGHFTTNFQQRLKEEGTEILPIPTGCSTKCQPITLCINKLFRERLQTHWHKFISSVLEDFPNSKIPSPTNQQMLDWVVQSVKYLKKQKELIALSFHLCGVTTTETEKVRNEILHREFMEKTLIEEL
uniref:HTH CENPB-type domain-containing protein n=1 Tax=Clytia hemisphaerica TaxID=252671 RepID=A0A7M5X3T6_9CNID